MPSFFDPDLHIEKNPDNAPLRRFFLQCLACREHAISLRLGFEDGEASAVLECTRCRTRETSPARLVAS